MRIFDNNKQDIKLLELKCNKCGKNIIVKNGIVQEGVFSIDYNWGYFSRRDGEIDSFDLCEECYNKITKEYVIPVEITENNE